nr:hypothetical protein [Verrucomicrobium spinosum]
MGAQVVGLLAHAGGGVRQVDDAGAELKPEVLFGQAGSGKDVFPQLGPYRLTAPGFQRGEQLLLNVLLTPGGGDDDHFIRYDRWALLRKSQIVSVRMAGDMPLTATRMVGMGAKKQRLSF